MRKSYRSRPLAAIHETATGLREAGLIDRRTMKGFDKICLSSEVSARRRRRKR